MKPISSQKFSSDASNPKSSVGLESKKEIFQDFFKCDSCGSRDFTVVYNFSLLFHGVNFSDDLIYDRLADQLYQCLNCNKRFTAKQIEEGLSKIKNEMRGRQI